MSTEFDCGKNSQNIAKCNNIQGTCAYSYDHGGNSSLGPNFDGQQRCFKGEEITINGIPFNCPGSLSISGADEAKCQFTSDQEDADSRSQKVSLTYVIIGGSIAVFIILILILYILFSGNKSKKI